MLQNGVVCVNIHHNYWKINTSTVSRDYNTCIESEALICLKNQNKIHAINGVYFFGSKDPKKCLISYVQQSQKHKKSIAKFFYVLVI